MRTAIRLGWRLLRSDWKSSELHTLLAALILAVAAVCAVTVSTERLEGAMVRQSTELLGGDLVMRSSHPISASWEARAAALGVETARILLFSSVVMSGDELQLVSVKTVSDSYPLRGSLRVADAINRPDRDVAQGPAAGEVWADRRILENLGIAVGEQIEIGASELPVTQVLTYEPDSVSGFAFLSPRVMMNEADLEAAQVIAPGSRIRYRLLFAGGDIETLRTELAAGLTEHERLQDVTDGEGAAFDAFEQGQQYIKITALLAVLLAAAAIAMSAQRYSRRHLNTNALLRCFGSSQRQIVLATIWQITLIARVACAVGSVLGFMAHYAIFAAVADLLPPDVPPPNPFALLPGIATGFLLMGGVALPPLLRMSGVPPLRMLRRDLEPPKLSVWALYLLPPLLLGTLLLLLGVTDPLVLMVLAGLLLALLAVGGGIYLLLRSLKRVRHKPAVLGRLGTHAGSNAGQIVAIATALLAIGIMAELRGDLLDRWRLQLPENAPNHFIMNLQPHERTAFSELLQTRSIEAILHPVVRARMVSINDTPVQSYLDNDTKRTEDGLDFTREHNLSWSDQLGQDNELVRGEWPPRLQNHGLSLEDGFARQLGVDLGDRITFESGGQRVTGTISSIRKVVWETLSANFFMVMAPGSLDTMPATFLTSFHVPPSDRALVADIARQFPAVNIISVESILAQLQTVLGQVTLAVELMVAFVLAGGIAVLFAVIQAGSDRRLHEAAVMRAVGASRKFLLQRHLAEFTTLGLVAGLLAASGADIACRVMYQQFFNLQYSSNLMLWLGLPLIAALITGLFGHTGTRHAVTVSPKAVLDRVL